MFLALKLLRVGIKQTKKHSSSKRNPPSQPSTTAWPEPHPHAHYCGFNQMSPSQQPYPDYYNNTTNMQIPMPSTYSSSSSPPSSSPAPSKKTRQLKTHLESLLRLIQFILSLTTIGLYGHDIQPTASSSDPKWVYAVVIAFLSASTCFIYIICNMLVMKSQPLGARSAARLPVFVWECVLVVTWLVVFGIFGKMFIGSYGRGDNVERMRHAVYLDLVVLVLFGGSGAWMGLRWWKGRREGDSGSNDGEKGLEMG